MSIKIAQLLSGGPPPDTEKPSTKPISKGLLDAPPPDVATPKSTTWDKGTVFDTNKTNYTSPVSAVSASAAVKGMQTAILDFHKTIEKDSSFSTSTDKANASFLDFIMDRYVSKSKVEVTKNDTALPDSGAGSTREDKGEVVNVGP